MITPNPAKNEVLTGLSYEEYEALPGVRQSNLWTLAQWTPAHMMIRMEEGLSTEALRFGRLVHLAILEPDEFEARAHVIERLNWTTKAGKEQKAEVEEMEARGIEVVTTEEIRKIERMRTNLMCHKYAAPLLAAENRETELCLTWTDPESGVACKARLDMLIESSGITYAVDLKTTIDARPWKLQYKVRDYGYHFQGAYYTDGLRACLGVESTFALIAIEKASCIPAVFQIGDRSIQYGREEYRRALRLYARCETEGHWPAYVQGPDDLILEVPVKLDEVPPIPFGQETEA